MINKQQNGGMNSFVKEVKSNDEKKIIFKKYKDNDKERIQREIEFLLELEKNNLKNVPVLLKSNKEEGWITMSYLAGDKVEALDKEAALAIISFLKEINGNKLDSKLGYAKDAYLSKYNVARDIRRRIRIFKMLKREKISSEFNKWVYNKLIEQALKELKIVEGTSFWDTQRNELIISPSDLGIHNMLTMKGKYCFIDFEYAGLDNPNKTILDLICQPNHCIDRNLEEYLIRELGSLVINKGENWRNELSAMKQIIIIKWCFIMMNSIKMLDHEKEKNIMAYYSRTCQLMD